MAAELNDHVSLVIELLTFTFVDEGMRFRCYTCSIARFINYVVRDQIEYCASASMNRWSLVSIAAAVKASKSSGVSMLRQ